MKFTILKSIAPKKEIDYHKFVDSISLNKRQIAVLNDNSFDLKILATAAPDCYARIIAKNEKFHACLATNFPNSSYNNDFDNIRGVKKNSVVNYLFTKGFTEIDTLVTDHIDDLPLMKLAKLNLIVSPNEELKNQLKQNQILFKKIL